MKRTLIIPAAAALLTGMAATAQETNPEDVDINVPEAVIYTSDQPQLDELTIAELNALQLQELQSISDVPETGEPVFQAETHMADVSQVTRTERLDPDPEIESYAWDETVNPQTDHDETVAMGGPEYASEADATADFTAKGTILDLTATDQRFTTLATLVRKANLAGAFESGGPYTVFAPTDAAFEKLDPDLVSKLESGEADARLDKILKAHIVEGEIMSEDIADGDTMVETLAGTELRVERDSSAVMVNNASVISADIGASNGVVHAIDAVIIPADETPAIVEAEADTGMQEKAETQDTEPMDWSKGTEPQ